MNNESIDDLLEAIRERYDTLISSDYNDKILDSFRAHLKSLSMYYDEPMDYPEIKDVVFPDKIFISCATCHPDCGVAEFIVDGSTQECQNCGSTMFRGSVECYQKSDLVT